MQRRELTTGDGMYTRNFTGKGETGEMEENEKKDAYTEPKVLASYRREDLEEIIRPHGMPPEQPGGGGCGCGGGGSILP